MLTSDDKVGGWVIKGQNHDDVILEWSLKKTFYSLPIMIRSSERYENLGVHVECKVF